MAELFASASSEGGVTRCPSCRTAFRVHAGQLAQHGGMVRCGKCDHAFNARDHLIVAPTAQAHAAFNEPPPVPTEALLRKPLPEPVDAPAAPSSGANPIEAAAPEHTPVAQEPASAPALAWPFSAPVLPAGHVRNPTSHTDARSQPRTMAMPADFPSDDPVAAPAPAAAPEAAVDDAFPPLRHEPLDGWVPENVPSGDAGANVPLPLIEALGTAQASIRADDHVHAGASLDELDFGPRRKPARASAGWVLAGLLLAFALALQVVYQYRGDIAILVPEARPLLADACAMAGCELPLPRLEKLVSIEDSDLQADTTNPTVMVLSAVLRNRAPFAQSYPAIELSLTDDRNETVARRVLGPEEYLARVPGKDPKEGFAATTELPLKVFIDAGAVKATGYRLYLFYP